MPVELNPNAPHVRLGEVFYRLASAYEQTGIRAMRRPWRSLFPDRQNISGGPGIQNVRSDDLRWLMTSFALGGGQSVIDPAEPTSFQRFSDSRGIDLSEPGQLKLAKAMVQQGLVGGGATTVEADTWTNVVGTSTVVNTTDRRLNLLNDQIEKSISLAAGTSQVDIWGYLNALVPLNGGVDFHEVQATASPYVPNPNQMRMPNIGSTIETNNQSFPAGEVAVAAQIISDAGRNTVRMRIVDKTSDEVVASTEETVTAGVPGIARLTFTAKAAHNYRVWIRYIDGTLGSTFILVGEVTLDPQDTKTMTWELRDGGVVKASGSVDMSGIETTRKLVSVSQLNATGGAHSYTVRFKWAAGTRKLVADKLVFNLMAMHDPRLIRLGLDNRIWLIDYDSTPGLSTAFYWNPATAAWVAVGTFGASGSKGIAITHSDHYEFVAMDDKKVYRITTGAVAQVTTVTTDPIVGLAFGGNRLFALTESQGSGSELFEIDPEQAPTFAPVSKYPVGNKGVAPDTDVSQRMAGTKNGAVWFANQGPDCWVYAWDGLAGAPVQKIPTGFRGRAIAHGSGLTWVGGSFPAADTAGVTRNRPAIFVVIGTEAGAPVQMLDAKLYFDEDTGTHIQAMQLYGSDLWVQTQVDGATRKMRLWRISLAGTPAAFLYQEIDTGFDETSTSSARGLAITWKERMAAWSTGSPYRESTTYPTAGVQSWVSSRYAYGLTEEKLLTSLRLVADIPTGSWVELWYAADEGDFTFAKRFTAPGQEPVSRVGSDVRLHYVRIMAILHTDDANVTPTVQSIEAAGVLQEYDKAWELLLACLDENSVWRLNGQQLPGSVGIANLFALADAGGIIEFEDRYSSARDEETVTYAVTLETPDAEFVGRGQAFVRVRLTQRE